ncbi:MAG: FG-GAP-like repeat-containing protein [Solirubrobacterales bacterium]
MPIVHPRRVFLALGIVCLIGLALAESASAVSFTTATNYPVNGQPFGLVSADFNGDGKADMATGNVTTSTISILLGDGSGGFAAATNVPVGNQPFDLATADFNGDGKADLATSNSFANSVSIFLGNGSGGFGAATTFPILASGAQTIRSADFNGDGKADLLTGNIYANSVSVLLGNGSGGFGAAATFPVGNQPYDAISADFNGDGKADIITANYGSANISVLLGNGAGGFAPATNFPAGANAQALAQGDFNGDGKRDLAVANAFTGGVSILLGNGSGGFGAPTSYPVGNYPYSLATADFDGDGKLDLLSANLGANSVSVMLGNGAGGFGAPNSYAVGNSPWTVIAADFNGDGSPDIAASNRSTNNVSVLLNIPPAIADVQITKTAAPTNARPGDVVTYTLKAKNIGAAAANNVVVTDSLPVGLSFVSADAPCLQSLGTVTCNLGTLSPAQEVTLEVKVGVDPWGTANPAADHLLDVQRVEAQIDLNAGEQKTVSVNCPSGFFTSDGSVRIDLIDQGAGDWPTPQVLESKASSLGIWQGTVKNTATGRAQAKIFAVCIRQNTVSGNHSHNLIVSAPVTATSPLPAGLNSQTLQCGPGQVAVQPGSISTTPADLVYSQPDGNGWKFTLDNHAPANVTFSIRCLTRQVAFASGHTHDLKLQRIFHDVVVDPGKVNEARLTCADGSKGIVAGWDLDHGLLSLGNDPRPVTRAYKLYNPTNAPLHARLSLLCLGDRTAGEHLAPQQYINTAMVSTSSAESSGLNNSASATVTAEDTDNFTPVPNPPTVKPTPNNPIGSTRLGGIAFLGKSSVTATVTCGEACSGKAKLFSLRGFLLASGNYRLNAAGTKKLTLKVKGKKAKQVLKKIKKGKLRLSNGSWRAVRIGS